MTVALTCEVKNKSLLSERKIVKVILNLCIGKMCHFYVDLCSCKLYFYF